MSFTGTDNRPPSLTGIYSLLQAPIWMAFVLAAGFAAVYLQGLGYSNSELGILGLERKHKMRKSA